MQANPIKYRQWGEGLESEAVKQMDNACRLPISVAGALMPDAHVGYGLPIGGVLATENAVIPFAVDSIVALLAALPAEHHGAALNSTLAIPGMPFPSGV